MINMLRKGFIRYTKRHWPKEAGKIIRRVDELLPVMSGKAPDIGGRENALSYNLDMMILSAAFYEASDHRIDGEAIKEVANDLYNRLRWIRGFININRKWQMKLVRSTMNKRYVPYAKLVEEKVARGEWGNTWRIRINPRNTEEGMCFDLVGCPLADFARANGYECLLSVSRPVRLYMSLRYAQTGHRIWPSRRCCCPNP